MTGQRVDLLTMAGIGMALMPLLTMWHEIGGHAAACAVQGGHVATIGAFYVECTGLSGIADIIVALAGVTVNAILACIAYLLWRGAKGDRARLLLWLIWVSESFVAAGYFCFSGATGFGDLGTGEGGSLTGMPMPLAWRVGEFAFGVIAYILLVRAAIRTLTIMLGDSEETGSARRRIAHVYYATAGLAAVVVGLMNPVGIVITIMSAAASSFGGLAGFISIGFATPHGTETRPFVLARSWPLLLFGIACLAAFAILFGPSRNF
ncbi:MAG: hypothetical protein KF730_01320 [Sphingomonas sp.]|uniref:hypothetical protein n=1 Tax=Sphingomonas sp. TaxID=28214 RepID=UPI0025D25E11|nr:hypothetical protein [Sphingomonas sp.]MBX3563192.1 hypothetical protein [Sphingomonas sp.]